MATAVGTSPNKRFFNEQDKGCAHALGFCVHFFTAKQFQSYYFKLYNFPIDHCVPDLVLWSGQGLPLKNGAWMLSFQIDWNITKGLFWSSFLV